MKKLTHQSSLTPPRTVARVSLFLALFAAQSAGATEWHVFGARALGMGGAGVAASQGPVGHYWNPASLGQAESPSGVQVPVGAAVNITGTVLEGANDLNQLVKDCPAGANCTVANIQAALQKINNPDNGVRVDAGGGVNVKVKRLAVFANGFSYVGGRPTVQIDVNNTAGTVSANQSKVSLRGIRLLEFGVGYGLELPFLPGLHVGGNLKGIAAKVGYQDVFFASENSGSGSLSKFDDTSKDSFQPGIDVGVLWDMNKTVPILPFRPRAGLTLRNINNPKFKQPDQAKAAGEANHFSLQGNSRLGVALSPFKWWHLAMDADLTKNLTPLDGAASQVVGVGTEINVFNRDVFNIPLRAGLSRNVAQKGAKTALHLGLGLNFVHVMADVSVYVTPASQTIQSQGKTRKVPSGFSIAGQVGFLLGGKAKD